MGDKVGARVGRVEGEGGVEAAGAGDDGGSRVAAGAAVGMTGEAGAPQAESRAALARRHFRFNILVYHLIDAVAGQILTSALVR